MAHTNLDNHYMLMFNLVQHNKYSIYDLEHSYPFELDIYKTLLEQYLNKKPTSIEL